MIKSRPVFLKMRSFSGKRCSKSQNTRLMLNHLFFRKSCSL